MSELNYHWENRLWLTSVPRSAAAATECQKSMTRVLELKESFLVLLERFYGYDERENCRLFPGGTVLQGCQQRSAEPFRMNGLCSLDSAPNSTSGIGRIANRVAVCRPVVVLPTQSQTQPVSEPLRDNQREGTKTHPLAAWNSHGVLLCQFCIYVTKSRSFAVPV